MHILVIEDESLIRETMASILDLDGHVVTLAADGERGGELFTAGRYDLVLTDLGMPGLSGWEVVKALKQHRADVPVIVVTGWGVAIDQPEIDRHRVDGVLAKPFDMKTLLQLVQRVTT